MMNEATLQTFSGFCVAGMPCSVRQLPYLTPEEHTLFLHVAEGNIRLEQERISHGYALEHIYRHSEIEIPRFARLHEAR